MVVKMVILTIMVTAKVLLMIMIYRVDIWWWLYDGNHENDCIVDDDVCGGDDDGVDIGYDDWE